jgi:uncharacterized protein
MSQEQLISQLREVRANLQSRGVSHLAMFGSRARGNFRPDSDVDLLLDVKLDQRFSLLDLVEVERIVSDKTKLPANAFMRRSLDAEFRKSIDPDIIEIF